MDQSESPDSTRYTGTSGLMAVAGSEDRRFENPFSSPTGTLTVTEASLGGVAHRMNWGLYTRNYGTDMFMALASLRISTERWISFWRTITAGW